MSSFNRNKYFLDGILQGMKPKRIENGTIYSDGFKRYLDLLCRSKISINILSLEESESLKAHFTALTEIKSSGSNAEIHLSKFMNPVNFSSGCEVRGLIDDADVVFNNSGEYKSDTEFKIYYRNSERDQEEIDAKRNKSSLFEVGDIVIRKDGCPLASGSFSYGTATVYSLDPFTLALVSDNNDTTLTSTVKEEDFEDWMPF